MAGLRPEWDRPTAAYAAPALPRVFWTGSWEVRGDGDLAEPMVQAARGEVAVLAEPIPGLAPPAPASPPRPASGIAIGSDSLRAEVDAPAAGVVVVLDPWFPGWSAEVDGAPARVARADFAFMAVGVGAGRHRVELRYRNDRLVPGALLAAGAGAALLLLLARRRRARGATPAG
jgi:hypothetical protein